jgi:hypothetical protein
LKSKLGYIVILIIFLGTGNLLRVRNAKAFPVLPSSFYGIVQVDGVNVETGTKIQALINDQVFAESFVQMYVGDSVYSITVPGDDNETNQVDGGREGERIVFVIGNIMADQTGEWHSGTNLELNLSGSSSNQIGNITIASTPSNTQTIEEPRVEPTQVSQEATQDAAPPGDNSEPLANATYQPTSLPLIDLRTPEPNLASGTFSNTILDTDQQSMEGKINPLQPNDVQEENQSGNRSSSLTSTTIILGGLGLILIAALVILAWMRWR